MWIKHYGVHVNGIILVAATVAFVGLYAWYFWADRQQASSSLPLISYAGRGSTATVPRDERVTVQNPDAIPVASKVFEFAFEETCTILRGGKMVEVAEVVRNPGDVHEKLVRYTHEGKEGGLYCPDGTLFYRKLYHFERDTQLYVEATEGEEVRKELVRRLLRESGQ